MDSPDRDLRGIKRGKCWACSNCQGFQWSRTEVGSKACLNCNCPPGRHEKTDTGQNGGKQSQISQAAATTKDAMTVPNCQYCYDDAFFDVNTRTQYPCCQFHMPYLDIQDQLQDTTISNIPKASYIHSTGSSPAKDPSLCAIEECLKPRHVDKSGHTHECCGFTHAIELCRRRAIERTKQPVVKGVTHCLLKDCNKVVWPFMNYCSKSHAEIGKKHGLKPPDVTSIAAGSKPSFLCALPGCNRPKRRNSKDGRLFDFCGRTHAREADEKGIKVAPAEDSGPKLDSICRLDGCIKPKKKSSDGEVYEYCCKEHAEIAKSNASSITKDESMCIIPECSRPRYVDPETKKESYYCSRSHVQEGQQRGIQPILKSRDEVDKFLQSFSSTLCVVDLKENDHAKPGGELYKKFIAARNALPVSGRKTCLAFHGTADTNIDSICTNGYDPSRRSRQACGPGEYFAVTPDVPLTYVSSGGKRILLNELLLGQNGVHHTTHGDYVVMKNPEHDLPRFVITFH